jgi:hypothetical protein
MNGMHNALTRMLLLAVALLAAGGCASTNLTGTLGRRPFVARGAYAEQNRDGQLLLYATQYEGDVLTHKQLDEGDVVLWVILPRSATGRLPVQGKRSPAQVAIWPFSWSSPGDGADWRYGDGSVEVVSLSRTRAHLRVDARFPDGGVISGELIAPVHSRD